MERIEKNEDGTHRHVDVWFDYDEYGDRITELECTCNKNEVQK